MFILLWHDLYMRYQAKHHSICTTRMYGNQSKVKQAAYVWEEIMKTR